MLVRFRTLRKQISKQQKHNQMNDLLFYPALTAPYKRWGDNKLFTGTQSICTKMTGNEFFTSIAAAVGAYAEVSETFGNKIAIASNRDKNAIIVKEMVRLDLISATLNLSNSVSQIANGDLQILVSSGMPLRKRAQPVVLTTPGNLVITAGSMPGELTTKVDAVKGVKSYVVKYTLDPQTPASTWTSVTCTTRYCTLTGLQSGAKYWIMVGAVGGNGQTKWSVTQISAYVP